ncbi:branched-chain alpha-keto acid dehydrogenase subunit E2, partial [Jannaschia sp. EhC01]
PAPTPDVPGESPVELPDREPLETPELPPEENRLPPLDTPSPPPADDIRASPAARARARELGIDLRGIRGTGPDGVIVLGDVERTQPASDVQQALAPPEKDPKAEMRKAIAAAMVRSKQTIPHFYLYQTFDMQPAQDHLAQLNKDRAPSDRLLLGALLVRATALAARDCPTLNGHYVDNTFTPSTEINVGLAIALRGGGLVAPALMQADTLDLDKTMAAMRDLVSRARTGRLRGREMTAGTITLSSLGDNGAEAMSGVIFPPQVALVGLGSPKTRPWVIEGMVEPRSVVQMTLSVDHRANDGRQASRFIAAFESHLQTPEEL